MKKIVDFNSVNNNLRKLESSTLDYERLSRYREMIEVQLGIMDELFLGTEKMLRSVHLNPGAFMLMDDSAERFLSADLKEFYDGGEESLELCFEAVIKGVRYRTYACAAASGENLEFEYMLMKWDGTEWLVHDGNTWVQGPGADFFGGE